MPGYAGSQQQGAFGQKRSLPKMETFRSMSQGGQAAGRGMIGERSGASSVVGAGGALPSPALERQKRELEQRKYRAALGQAAGGQAAGGVQQMGAGQQGGDTAVSPNAIQIPSGGGGDTAVSPNAVQIPSGGGSPWADSGAGLQNMGAGYEDEPTPPDAEEEEEEEQEQQGGDLTQMGGLTGFDVGGVPDDKPSEPSAADAAGGLTRPVGGAGGLEIGGQPADEYAPDPLDEHYEKLLGEHDAGWDNIKEQVLDQGAVEERRFASRSAQSGFSAGGYMAGGEAELALGRVQGLANAKAAHETEKRNLQLAWLEKKVDQSFQREMSAEDTKNQLLFSFLDSDEPLTAEQLKLLTDSGVIDEDTANTIETKDGDEDEGGWGALGDGDYSIDVDSTEHSLENVTRSGNDYSDTRFKSPVGDSSILFYDFKRLILSAMPTIYGDAWPEGTMGVDENAYQLGLFGGSTHPEFELKNGTDSQEAMFTDLADARSPAGKEAMSFVLRFMDENDGGYPSATQLRDHLTSTGVI